MVARGAAGKRVLVLHAPSLDYIVSLFVCVYAGAVAVPAYPPRAGRPMLRLRSIIADTKAAMVPAGIVDRVLARRVLLALSAGAGMWLVAHPLSAVTPWLAAPLSVLGYAACLYAIGGLEPSQIQAVRRILVRRFG